MAHRPGHSFESDVQRAIRKATSRRRCQSTHAPTAFLCGYACKGFAQDVRAIGFTVMVIPWDFTPIPAIADPLHARADKADVSRVRTIVIPARDAPTRLPDFLKRRNAGGVRYPYGGKLSIVAFPHADATRRLQEPRHRRKRSHRRGFGVAFVLRGSLIASAWPSILHHLAWA
jgi:hypothetical protein